MGFFYDLAGGLEDLDLHLLLADQALEVADPLLRLAEGARRDHVLIGGDPRLRPRLDPWVHSRITLGWMSNSRLTSANVFSPLASCCTIPRLNSAVKIRRPSALLGHSPMRGLLPASAG